MEHRALGLVGLLSLSAISAMMTTACAGGSRVVSTTTTTRGGLVASPTSAARDVPARELGLQAGDYVVYRFSGTFRTGGASPLLLTQRVLGRDGGVLALEITLEDGAKQETLRIRKDATPGSAEEVFDVTRIEAGVAHSASVDAYAALMAKTVVAADANEAELGAEQTSMRLGGRTLRCTRTSYRVRVGKHVATMSTMESKAFPWGDVGGDITTADGQVLYRVEVVEAGSGTRERPVAVMR